jgi:hypothetical protein
MHDISIFSFSIRAHAAVKAKPQTQKEAPPVIDFSIVMEQLARKKKASKGTQQQARCSNITSAEGQCAAATQSIEPRTRPSPSRSIVIPSAFSMSASEQFTGAEGVSFTALPQDLSGVEYEDDDLEIVDDGPGKVLKVV